MKLNSNLYFGFDALFYLVMGISGLYTPGAVMNLFNLPPSIYKHEELAEFIYALTCLYANVLGVVNIAQAVSFIIALVGDDETKRTVSKINAFINVVLAMTFWYNIHYAHNPKNDITEHLLFKEQGISAIWFNNLWTCIDSIFLLYLGVYKKSVFVVPAEKTTTTSNKIKRK